MDSNRSSESSPRIPLKATIVLGMLVLAFALSVTAVAQVLEEYRMLSHWLERSGSVTVPEIESLRQEIGARIIVRSLASIVLLLCTLATLWLQQRQLAISRALDEMRLIAHNILSSLNDGVITTDRVHVVTSINPAAIDLIGVSVEAIGRPVADLSRADVPLEEMCRSVTERPGASIERELLLERAGLVRRLVASALELKDTRRATIGCVIHLRDVTEIMLMKEQVWRMEQFASLSTMASGLLHEIRNPMTALSIHAQLLEERLGDGQAVPQAGELLGILRDEIRRLNNTLSSFRDFARLDRLEFKPTGPRKILEDVARLIEPQAARQGVRLELVLGGPSVPEVAIDPEKIGQAVLNLVLNALEAMPSGGDLTLGFRARDGRLTLSVTDSGPGIAPEIQDHVFRPYFSTKGNGTGMGLALAEKLVRQHGGQLSFRTGPHGTTFAITLPTHASAERS